MLPPETIRSSIEERLFGFPDTERPDKRIQPTWAPLRWTPPQWTRASGGLSRASVWRVESGGDVYAVRRWWAGISPTHLAWINRTLQVAVSSRLPFVAAPLENDFDRGWPLCDDHDGRWEATPWKPGDPLTDASSQASIAAAVTGLARFHRHVRDVEGGPPAGRSAFVLRAEQLDTLRSAPMRVETSMFKAWPRLEPIVHLLPEAAERAELLLMPYRAGRFPLQPIHGDPRPEHFLMTGGELTGLVDFGAMRRDTVLADVARLAGELAAGDPAGRDAVVTAYAAAAGVPVDTRAIAALDLAGAVLSAANWVRWLGEPDADRFDPQLVGQRLRSIAGRLVCG